MQFMCLNIILAAWTSTSFALHPRSTTERTATMRDRRGRAASDITLQYKKSSTWNHMLRAFAAQTNERVESYGSKKYPKTIVLSLSDWSYSSRFDELLISVKSYADVPAAMIALDGATFDFFRARGVPALLANETYDWPYHSIPGKSFHHRAFHQLNERILRTKIEGTSVLLDAGLTVVFSEMDVYWTRDPLATIASSKLNAADFLGESQAQNTEICIGFFLARPTHPMTSAFRSLRAWVSKADRWNPNWATSRWKVAGSCGHFDQQLVNYMIRGEHGDDVQLKTQCHMPYHERTSIYQNAIDWNYIPMENLPHWDSPYGPLGKPSVPNDASLFAVHIWTSSNMTGEQRNQWAYDHGFWHPDADPPSV